MSRVIQSGGYGIFLRCDVTSIRQVQETVSQTIKRYGRIDILVNNAGGVPGPDRVLPLMSRKSNGTGLST